MIQNSSDDLSSSVFNIEMPWHCILVSSMATSAEANIIWFSRIFKVKAFISKNAMAENCWQKTCNFLVKMAKLNTLQDFASNFLNPMIFLVFKAQREPWGNLTICQKPVAGMSKTDNCLKTELTWIIDY